MDTSEVTRLTSEGIEAIKRGDKARGAELLIRASEADPRNEQAWLWLSLAVDSPEDKLIALENVLAINPGNVAARDQVRRWRQKVAGEPSLDIESRAGSGEPSGPVGAAAEPIAALAVREPVAAPPADRLAGYAPATRVDADDGIDDPYQCAYCGRPTEPEDRRCPHCGRDLMLTRPASIRASSVLLTAIFFTGMLLATGLFEIVPPLIAKFIAQGASPIPYRFLLQYPGADLLLGHFLNWSGPIATGLLTIAIGRAAIMLIVTVGLYVRSAFLYYSAMLFLLLDMIWNFYRAAAGYAGTAAIVLDLVMALIALATIFAAERDFQVVRSRITVKPDAHLRGAAAFYKAGHQYRKQGMWALAVAQWRQAVGAQPREVLYYKDLGVGYAQINRFERSLRVLEEGARQAPDDLEIPQMISLAMAERDKAAAQGK